MPLSDIQCAFCNRHINVTFANGERHVDTKYWREDNPRIYFCDGYCATGLHEKERHERRREDQKT